MTQRYHSLDSLRGIVMWLGIVIHVACNHMAGDSIIPWRDSETGKLADLIVIFLHTFRMPAFFILAGFFGAMLLQRYGTKGMVINRAKRLALPFAVFFPIILVSTTVLGQLFLSKMHSGFVSFNLDAALDKNGRPLLDTYHLWFLYYLIWFFISAVLVNKISRRVAQPVRDKITAIFSSLATHWWGFALLTLPLVYAGLFYEFGFVAPNGSLIPNIGEFLHNGVFFGFGWLFFLNKDFLMNHYEKKCWRYTTAGFIVFISLFVLFGMFEKGKLNTEYAGVIISFTYNMITWFWSLALIGIFLRYFPKPNKTLRYLSDSSYWVYLMHIVGTAGFGILLYDTSLSLAPKMLINIILTTLACLVTYHLFVRNTWIGVLLNGKKHAKNGDLKIRLAAEQTQQ